MVPAPSPPPATRPPPTDRKSTLYCACGRSEPLPDWPVRDRATEGGREVLSCPDCGRVVVSQPVLTLPA